MYSVGIQSGRSQAGKSSRIAGVTQGTPWNVENEGVSEDVRVHGGQVSTTTSKSQFVHALSVRKCSRHHQPHLSTLGSGLQGHGHAYTLIMLVLSRIECSLFSLMPTQSGLKLFVQLKPRQQPLLRNLGQCLLDLEFQRPSSQTMVRVSQVKSLKRY